LTDLPEKFYLKLNTMPPEKNRLEGNENHVVDKHQKKTHEPVSDSDSDLKDPDADVVDEDGEDEDGEDRNEGGMYFGDIYIPPPPAPSLTMDASGPRLVITHIENFYFKSYAGKQVLGPFHKSFTSIIGPNGSGKSNVIDSMLFVFGYRANKIRSKSVAVLIHNSENHPNVQSCSVAVHFQMIEDINDDEFNVVPGSQFVVSRSAFKVIKNTIYAIFIYHIFFILKNFFF
jgi:structural maintenance of chromosome 4